MTCNTSAVAVCCSKASRVSVMQPRVLHRDDRLRREVLQQRDLLVGERVDFCAIGGEAAEQRVVLAQRAQTDRVRTPPCRRRPAAPERAASIARRYRRYGRAARPREPAQPTAGATANGRAHRSATNSSDSRGSREPREFLPVVTFKERRMRHRTDCNAFSSIASNTGARSPGEALMTCNTSAVAVCWARASSRSAVRSARSRRSSAFSRSRLDAFSSPADRHQVLCILPRACPRSRDHPGTAGKPGREPGPTPGGRTTTHGCAGQMAPTILQQICSRQPIGIIRLSHCLDLFQPQVSIIASGFFNAPTIADEFGEIAGAYSFALSCVPPLFGKFRPPARKSYPAAPDLQSSLWWPRCPDEDRRPQGAQEQAQRIRPRRRGGRNDRHHRPRPPGRRDRAAAAEAENRSSSAAFAKAGSPRRRSAAASAAPKTDTRLHAGGPTRRSRQRSRRSR